MTINQDPSTAISYWLAASPAGPRRPGLRGAARADVAIVGAGFTGLWAAIALTDTDPSLRVVVLEQETVGFGASGRNGGFCQASLTHGLDNGLRHFPDEIELLEREGLANLGDLIAFTREHGIDCDLEETGSLAVADQPYQVEEFRASVGESAPYGEELVFLDRAEIQAEVHSPLWLAGLYQPPGRDVILDPAKLVRGLARVCEERGIAIHEDTRVRAVDRRAGGVRLTTDDGATIDADHVVVATSAYSGWLRRLESHFVPVYDYVLVSDPLTPDQMASIGWARRQGMADANNQFHYFRLTADDRILWGGYDAIYYRNNGVGPQFDQRPATFTKLEIPLPAGVPPACGRRVPVPLGRRDRHDLAVHRHVRPGVGRPAHLRDRVHRARRRGEPLGGRRGPGLHPAAGLGPAPTALRPIPARAVPARAAPLDRGERRPPRARPGGPQRGPPGADPQDPRRLRDRLRLVAQTGVVTQFGSSRVSVARGSEPWARTWSWKARRSNAAPSRAVSSRRSFSISRQPSM